MTTMTAHAPTVSACAAPAGSIDALAEVRQISATAARLTGVIAGAAAWRAQDRRDLLADLDRAVDGLAAVRAAVLLAERESGAWQGDGDRSFEVWRARTSLAGERAAVAQVRQAEHLAAVPSVAAAVTEGRIGLAHAATIGRVAATGTAAQQAAVASPDGQAHLLQIAEKQDAGTFATTVAGFVADIDPDGLERGHQAQRRARSLHLADTPRGTLIKGQVDSMAGHRLRLALEALSPRPGADDDRDPGQRRADALNTMAERILSDADTKPGAHVRPHVSLIVTEQTWHAARAELARRRAETSADGAGAVGTTTGEASGHGTPGRPVDTHPCRGADGDTTTGAQASAGGDVGIVGEGAAGPGYEPATLEDGTPVPPSELAIALCDCDVTRIVIDAAGVPLDLGRTQRLFTGTQRRAVIARDRECAWPSCHAPARWCDIHHIAWWDRDHGATTLDNAVLVCSFHHHEVHRRDLTITRLTADRPVEPPGKEVAQLSGALAPVRYEFRDPPGRRVGLPPGAWQHRQSSPQSNLPSSRLSGRLSGREPPDPPPSSGRPTR